MVKPTRNVDKGRLRCVDCGHPQREHRADECTVPKCACRQYAPRKTKT
jgi:hypothetical protein